MAVYGKISTMIYELYTMLRRSIHQLTGDCGGFRSGLGVSCNHLTPMYCGRWVRMNIFAEGIFFCLNGNVIPPEVSSDEIGL